ncbi:MAG: translocation/assembly module TamB domain-containing protein, partial [Pseudomonadota bacterium]
ALKRARIGRALLAARGGGHLDTAPQVGALDYTFRSTELSPVTALYGVALGGAARAEGRATLAEAPRVAGTARLDGLSFEGTGYGNLALAHDVTAGEVPAGQLDLTLAESPYGEVSAGTAFAFAAPELTLSDISLAGLGISGTGGLALDTERTLAEGAIALRSSSLAPLSRLAGAAMNGTMRADLTLARPGGRQDAGLTANLGDLVFDEIRLGGADLTASLTDLLGRLGVAARLTATELAAGEATLETVNFEASGPLSALNLTAALAGALGEDPLSARFAARADAEGPAFGAQIATLEAALAEETLALSQPLTVRAEGQNVSVQGLDLALPRGGRLAGDLAKRGQGLSGDLRLTGLDASLAKRFADAPILAGTISAVADFDTRRRADIDLAAEGLRFENVEAAGEMALTTRATWDGRRANASGALEGGFGQPLRFEAELPLRPGLVPQVPSSGPLAARLTWQGAIGELFALVPAPGHFLTGQADVDLSVAGDISDPQLGGTFSLSDGGYQNLDLGTILTDLALETRAEPGGALGFDLSARDGGEGRVETRGQVALDGSGLTVNTTIDGAVLMRRDDVTARVDGQIGVDGPFDALAVDGDITLETVEVRLVANPTADIADLGEVLIKGQPEPEPETGDSSVSLRLDISSPGRIF